MNIHHGHAKHMGCLTAVAHDALAKMHVMRSKNLFGNTIGLLTEPIMKLLLTPVSGLNACQSLPILLPRPFAIFETHIIAGLNIFLEK